MSSHLLEDAVAIYTDGGLIGQNPSPIGGTWAWCAVNKDGVRLVERSGVVLAPEGRVITNNHTEQIAIVLALEAMPAGWCGELFSDSQVALGRVLWGWAEKNLPPNISSRSRAAVKRLGIIAGFVLKGHPTRAELSAGVSAKINLPVSEHNVWCDKACRSASQNFLG